MIILKDIVKIYNKEKVLDRFSYTFHDTGFYLIFGYSGSGKTTLINIIAGIIDFNEGSYSFFQESIFGKKDQKKLNPYVSYLTQDAYFIDYLTIEENFEISQVDQELAFQYISKFQLEELLNHYPDQCSAGQRQRLAIIQAISSHKKVLVLDEPTASLDKNNKYNIFELLKEISKTALVICVSHDAEAKNYADHIVSLEASNKVMEFPALKDTKLDSPKKKNKIDLYSYVSRMRKSNKKEKVSAICLLIMFTSLLLLVMNLYNPETKLINSLGNDYHLNYVNVSIPLDEHEKYISQLKEKYKNIESIIYPYRTGANYTKIQGSINHMTLEPISYMDSLVYETIPATDCFYLKNYLEEGSYFTKKNEVILGYDKALQYTSDLHNLIGESIVIETPKGSENFIVSGIFRRFSEQEKSYFQNGYSVDALNDVIYFNELYSNDYLNDDQYTTAEKMANNKGDFILYFDEFSSVMEFINNENNCDKNAIDCMSIYPISNFILSVLQEFQSISILLLPCAIIAMLISILFYGQTKIKELFQTRNAMSIYQYYGYSTREVIAAYKKYYRNELMHISFLATGLSIVIAYVLDNILQLIQFPLFTIDIFLCIGTACFLFLICYPIVYYIIYQIKKINWYQTITERRDLL